MKSSAIIVLLIGVLGIISCENDRIIETVDPSIQLQIDIEKINDYITEKAYDVDPGDTTSTGVRYVILNEGPGSPIEVGDIVDSYYIGRFLDGEIFDTNIDTVDINNDTYDSAKTYSPQRFTHTETGWAIRGEYIPGFTSGITAVFDRMNIGGKAEIIIPSGQAYGTGVPISSPLRDAVLVFEIYPTYKR